MAGDSTTRSRSPGRAFRYASWGARVAARILDGLILAIPSYLLIELLAPGLYERFEAWMYELVRAAQAGKSYRVRYPWNSSTPS